VVDFLLRFERTVLFCVLSGWGDAGRD